MPALRKSIIISLILVATNILVLAAFINCRHDSIAAAQNGSAGQQSQKYPLLAQRIFVEKPNDALINFTSLRAKLRQRFDNMPQEHSFYFEYLPTGTTIRHDGENRLVAASLVKLPLIMNLYHAAELKNIDLDEKIELSQSDLDNTFGELYKKGAGYKTTLRELAKLGIVQSDNTATRAINRKLEGHLKSSDESLPWLDVDYTMAGDQAVMSAREYSSIIKCLYFACYLAPHSSEEILTYLTESKYDARISEPIPKEIKVAHKIGVYNPENIHSDCGIIYVPQRPYVLCILIEGKAIDASRTMAEVSKDVYDSVTRR